MARIGGAGEQPNQLDLLLRVACWLLCQIVEQRDRLFVEVRNNLQGARLQVARLPVQIPQPQPQLPSFLPPFSKEARAIPQTLSLWRKGNYLVGVAPDVVSLLACCPFLPRFDRSVNGGRNLKGPAISSIQHHLGVPVPPFPDPANGETPRSRNPRHS